MLQGGALKGPHPVLVVVAVDAHHAGDGLTLWTLEIEITIVIIDPVLAEPACGKTKDKKCHQQHNMVVLRSRKVFLHYCCENKIRNLGEDVI